MTELTLETTPAATVSAKSSASDIDSKILVRLQYLRVKLISKLSRPMIYETVLGYTQL